MRVALVHDWIVSIRGAEKVLESLSRIYPGADLFTLRYDADGVRLSRELSERPVHTSFVDRLARLAGGPSVALAGFRLLLPFFPLAIESFRLEEYDLVISSSHAVAKGAIAPPGAVHVSYVHTPMRYIWEASTSYAPRIPGGAVGRAAFGLLAHYLRLWDTAATARVDALVANSRYTRDRIRRCYGRDAAIIEPPVEIERFERIPDPAPDVVAGAPPMYLCVSALVPYKRVELAVRAFLGRRERLVVVGEGADHDRLAGIAGAAPNIELRGRLDDAAVDALFAQCQAVIHPALDDFGIVPVEALAAGRPVVAFAGGGATDSVRDGETGVLFAEATPRALGEAVTRLQRLRFEPARLRAEGRRFDRSNFERRFAALVESCIQRVRSDRPRVPV
jgi:glycosyltransferase involved in cell wall biosynthesis